MKQDHEEGTGSVVAHLAAIWNYNKVLCILPIERQSSQINAGRVAGI